MKQHIYLYIVCVCASVCVCVSACKSKQSRGWRSLADSVECKLATAALLQPGFSQTLPLQESTLFLDATAPPPLTDPGIQNVGGSISV